MKRINLFSLPVITSIGLFLVSFTVLYLTLAPSIYTFDSAELVTGAWSLGIVHSPGYPLYLLILHLFMKIPLGDIAFRGNLFSAFCLALTAPFLFGILQKFLPSIKISASITLFFMWSFYIWGTGVFAEVYAPQILTITICLCFIIKPQDSVTGKRFYPLFLAILFGIAIAMHPTTLLFIPGIFLAIKVNLKFSWLKSMLTTIGGVLASCISIIYFPIRFSSNPLFNLAGYYNETGVFDVVNLKSIEGIKWLISGDQFDQLFFIEGVYPNWQQLGDVFRIFWGNFLGIGVFVGILGLVLMFRHQKYQFLVWLTLFMPFTYFYATYGAIDKQAMFGPSLLLWTIPIVIAFGFLFDQTPIWLQDIYCIGIPIIFLLANFSFLDLSNETNIRLRSEIIMQAAPENTYLFANWADITPLEYLQIAEGKRPDLHLYNLFLFPSPDVQSFMDQLLLQDMNVWVIGEGPQYQFPDYQFTSVDLKNNAAEETGLLVFSSSLKDANE